MIVRETPPAGREVSVSLLELPSLGWTVVLDAPGGTIAAAPAPLRLIDAQGLAAQVVSSRAGDAEPDRIGLANLLRRTSHLATDLVRLSRLELPRVVEKPVVVSPSYAKRMPHTADHFAIEDWMRAIALALLMDAGRFASLYTQRIVEPACFTPVGAL